MKNAVKEYLDLSNIEKETLWEKAVFIFDTNIFLNLYRYTAVTRQDLLKAMEELSDRVWMPKQIAQELMKDRTKVIFDTLKIKEDLRVEKEKFIKSCRERLRRETKDSKIEDMSKAIDRHIEKLMKESSYINNVDNDSILNKLLNLFDKKVGSGFSEEELESIKKEGAERYSKQIPPGYKDNKKGEDNNAFGDLIIWKEILRYAKTNNKDIIYVTGDQKEDWWNKQNGRTLGPRIELRKEFLEQTNQKFHMYSMDGFLTYFQKLQRTPIQQSAIDEVKNHERIINENDFRYTKRNLASHHRLERAHEEMGRLKNILSDLNLREEYIEKRIMDLGEHLPPHEIWDESNNLEIVETVLLEIERSKAMLSDIQRQKRDLIDKIESLKIYISNINLDISKAYASYYPARKIVEPPNDEDIETLMTGNEDELYKQELVPRARINKIRES